MAGCNHWTRNALAFWRLPVRATAAVLIAGTVAPAAAATLAGGAGYDLQAGPGGDTWSAPLGFAVVTGDRGNATASLSRFHSNDIGSGWSGLVNAGLLFGSHVGARAIGVRSVGDGDYRAWRLQAGPIFQIDSDRSVDIYVARFEDSNDARLDQLGAEGDFPLSARVSGLVGGAVGHRKDGATSAQATGGITWSAWKHLLLFSQGTFGKNIAATSATSGSAGSGGPLGSGPRGHMARTTESTGSPLQGMVLAGIRVVVP
jgi:hypothetical protein